MNKSMPARVRIALGPINAVALECRQWRLRAQQAYGTPLTRGQWAMLLGKTARWIGEVEEGIRTCSEQDLERMRFQVKSIEHAAAKRSKEGPEAIPPEPPS